MSSIVLNTYLYLSDMYAISNILPLYLKSAASLKGLVSLFFFEYIYSFILTIDSDTFVIHYVWLCLLRILLTISSTLLGPLPETLL